MRSLQLPRRRRPARLASASHAQSAYDYPWFSVYSGGPRRPELLLHELRQCMHTMSGIGATGIRAPTMANGPRTPVRDEVRRMGERTRNPSCDIRTDVFPPPSRGQPVRHPRRENVGWASFPREGGERPRSSFGALIRPPPAHAFETACGGARRSNGSARPRTPCPPLPHPTLRERAAFSPSAAETSRPDIRPCRS